MTKFQRAALVAVAIGALLVIGSGMAQAAAISQSTIAVGTNNAGGGTTYKMLDGDLTSGNFWETGNLIDANGNVGVVNGPAPTQSKIWATFNLNGLYNLNTMVVENSISGNRKVGYGVIQYSLDGINWTTLAGGTQTNGAYTFSSGSNTFTFTGSPQARMVRIGTPGAADLQMAGTVSGDTLRVGVNEVSFTGTLAVANTNFNNNYTEITGVTAVASAQGVGNGARLASKTVDNSGMHTNAAGLLVADSVSNNEWEGGVNFDANRYIAWNLGSSKNLQDMLIWNGNGTGAGYASVQILYSNDATDTYASVNWTVLGTLDMTNGTSVTAAATAADSTSGYASATAEVNFGGLAVKWVKMGTMVPYGTSDVSIAEVKFYEGAAVPEPATMAFLAIGGLGLAGAAVRRRRAV